MNAWILVKNQLSSAEEQTPGVKGPSEDWKKAWEKGIERSQTEPLVQAGVCRGARAHGIGLILCDLSREKLCMVLYKGFDLKFQF